MVKKHQKKLLASELDFVKDSIRKENFSNLIVAYHARLYSEIEEMEKDEPEGSDAIDELKNKLDEITSLLEEYVEDAEVQEDIEDEPELGGDDEMPMEGEGEAPMDENPEGEEAPMEEGEGETAPEDEPEPESNMVEESAPEEAPVETVTSDDAPVETEEIPTEEPAEEAPAEEAPAEEAPIEEAPVEEAPAEVCPECGQNPCVCEEAPAEEAPVEEQTPAEKLGEALAEVVEEAVQEATAGEGESMDVEGELIDWNRFGQEEEPAAVEEEAPIEEEVAEEEAPVEEPVEEEEHDESCFSYELYDKETGKATGDTGTRDEMADVLKEQTDPSKYGIREVKTESDKAKAFHGTHVILSNDGATLYKGTEDECRREMETGNYEDAHIEQFSEEAEEEQKEFSAVDFMNILTGETSSATVDDGAEMGLWLDGNRHMDPRVFEAMMNQAKMEEVAEEATAGALAHDALSGEGIAETILGEAAEAVDQDVQAALIQEQMAEAALGLDEMSDEDAEENVQSVMDLLV